MAPREGHLQAVLHMFMYLSTHQQSTFVLDPSYISHGTEPRCDSRCFYPDAKEEYPANAPHPLGRSAQITAFVDLGSHRGLDYQMIKNRCIDIYESGTHYLAQ